MILDDEVRTELLNTSTTGDTFSSSVLNTISNVNDLDPGNAVICASSLTLDATNLGSGNVVSPINETGL